MNLLSALSTILYTAFFIAAGYMLSAERKGVLNRSAAAVLLSLGWWSFCNSFFYPAATVEIAWFWHHLSAIGWCGFVSCTVYYFIALTDYRRKTTLWWKRLLFCVPPLLLTCKNLFGKTTSLAQKIIPSTNGLGWTYENSPTSFWLWAYLGYVALYFGVAFFLLYQWGKSTTHKMKKEMAIGFVLLDLVTILFGVITDVVFPLTRPGFPALASIGTALFGLGYFTIIYYHDVFNINVVISSDDILQIGNNPIFVMDENRELLKYNHAAGKLLGYSKSELIGTDFLRLTAQTLDLSGPYRGEELTDVEAKMTCRDGTVKDVLLSASAAKDKRHRFLCTIVSCQDVSRQKRIQEELALEREKYKALADDYQLLAYFDPLTGLPNRRHFFDMLHQFEQRYQTEQRDFAVIFLDLDNFKAANDLYGHEGGDELLKTASKRLQACLEDGEFAARLGGDEFMVMMPCAQPACAERKIQQIRRVFSQQILLFAQPYVLGISAGCAVFSQVGDVTVLMQYADEAMYGDKKGLFRRFPEA